MAGCGRFLYAALAAQLYPLGSPEAPLPDQLSVTFEYSPVDHADALAESPHLATIRKWWNVVGAALTGLIVVVTLLAAGDSPSFKATVMLFALLLPVPVFWFFMPSIQKRLQLARFRRARAADAHAPEIRTFGPNGFTASSEWRNNLGARVGSESRFLSARHVSDPSISRCASQALNLRNLLHSISVTRQRTTTSCGLPDGRCSYRRVGSRGGADIFSVAPALQALLPTSLLRSVTR
jgi:hypothetical protein